MKNNVYFYIKNDTNIFLLKKIINGPKNEWGFTMEVWGFK